MTQWTPDANNRELLLEYAVQTGTAPDGNKMGAPARVQVNSTGNPVENTEGTLLASAARTTTTASPIMKNNNARGIHVTLLVTAASGTGGLRTKVRGRSFNGGIYDITPNPTAIIAVGTYVYVLYPAESAAAVAGSSSVNGRTSATLPPTWDVEVGHVDGTSYTYSVSYALIL